MGRIVRVYWPNEEDWFRGKIDDYSEEKGYHVTYDDDDDEWIAHLDPSQIEFEDEDETRNAAAAAAGMNETMDSMQSEEVHIASTLTVRELNMQRELFDAEMAAQEEGGAAADMTADEEALMLAAGGDEEEDEDAGLAEELTAQIRRQQAGLADEGNFTESALVSATFEMDNTDSPDHYSSQRIQERSEARGQSATYDIHEEEDEGHAPQGQENAVILSEELYEDPNDPEDNFSLPVRGILLMGNVHGASNVPPAQEGEMDGRVFFKVLFVEGGTQATMFRCKTPIFTSLPAQDIVFPTWDKGAFRFEMILPEVKLDANGNNDAQSSAASAGAGAGKDRRLAPSVRAKQAANPVTRQPFEVKGEILIAVYRTRAAGGSEFVGQSVFDLNELSKTGTTAFPTSRKARGTQMRNVTGSFPVINRSGEVSGDGLCHLELHLELAWKPDPQDFPDDQQEEEGEGGDIAARARKQSSANSEDKPTQKVKGGKKPAVGLNGLVKQMTYNAKKNILEQHRINKENKILATRIKAHNIRGTNKHQSVKPAEDVYLSPPTDKFKPQNAAEEAQVLFQRKAHRMSHAELMDLYNDLKKDVAVREDSIKETNAKLTRLKAHSKKYELANQKMRQRVQADADSKNARDTRAIPKNSPMDAKLTAIAEEKEAAANASKSAISPYLQDAESKESQAKENASANANANTDSKQQYRDDKMAEQKERHIPAISSSQKTLQPSSSDLMAAYANELPATSELAELRLEHTGLQDARRVLVARIAKARRAVDDNTATLKDAQQRETMARQRLGSAFSNLGNKFAGGTKSVSGKAKTKEEEDADSHMDNDLQAIERVRGVQLELDRTQAAFDAGIHLGQLNDAIAELRSAEGALKKMLKRTNAEVDELKILRNKEFNALQKASQDRTALSLRETMAYQRERLLRLSRAQRMSAADGETDKIELEALRIQLRRQQQQTEMALGIGGEE